MPKGYIIAHITVTNPDAYQDYVRLDTPILLRHGGAVRGCVAGRVKRPEGNSLDRHVVVEFPLLRGGKDGL